MKTNIEIAKMFEEGIIEWTTAGDDTQFCFLEEDGENILLFAQSNSKKDWKNNLNFFKKPYKRMETKFYVHRGFLKCWKLINKEILKTIEDKKMDNLTIAGWSYGGALATLCTEDVWFHFPNLKTRTITFGAPKVFSVFGFKKIKHRFNNMTMFKNGADIVTKVPFNWMLFKHVTELTNIGDRPTFFRYFNPKKYHDISTEEKTGYINTLEKIKG